MSIVKSFSVGNGDMFYIKHGTDNFTIIDCCLSEDNKQRIVEELKSESDDKNVVRFISTHPDDDHICGLTYLHREMPISNFYCVKNATTKPDETDDFDQYRALRDDTHKAFHISRGCLKYWMNKKSDIRGSSGISVLWPDLTNPRYQAELRLAELGLAFNNISPIIQYSLEEGVDILWMGDMETEFMDEITESVRMPPVDILFAPHHGRRSGRVPSEWLNQMTPSLIVIGEAPAGHLHYYPGYNTITQNSAGDITFDCVEDKVHIFASNWLYSVDFLENDANVVEYGTTLAP